MQHFCYELHCHACRAFKGSCSPVIPCHWRLEVQKWWWWGGGVLGGRGNKKISLPAKRWGSTGCQSGAVVVVAEIMQMRRSVKQSWTRLTEGILGPRSWNSSSRSQHATWSECQDAWGAPALLFWLDQSDLTVGKADSFSDVIVEVPPSPHFAWILKNKPTSRAIGTNVESRTSIMATLACRWLPL